MIFQVIFQLLIFWQFRHRVWNIFFGLIVGSMTLSVLIISVQSRLGLKIFTCFPLKSSIENELSTFCIGASMEDVYASFKPWLSVAFLHILFIVLQDFTVDSNGHVLSLSSVRPCKPILSNDMYLQRD